MHEKIMFKSNKNRSKNVLVVLLEICIALLFLIFLDAFIYIAKIKNQMPDRIPSNFLVGFQPYCIKTLTAGR